MTNQISLKNTPLYQEHLSLGAQMAPFAGWNMPIQYDGIIAETLHTRKAASCFDICHMGEFLIKGDYKKSGLDMLVSVRISDLSIGACRYGSLLDENGGVIDDLIIYRKAQDEWFIVVNAATIEKDKKQFLKYLSKDSKLTDLSDKLGKIDLQGPLAKEIITKFVPEASKLNYYTFIETDIFGEKNILSRTGYTGELGFEIYASCDKIKEIWKTLLGDKRLKPAGLGSRDVLRLEMGYSLYGQDIDENTTPFEAGLEKFIDLDKDFIGKDALLKQRKSGLKQNRIFFKTLSRRSPRHNYKIYPIRELQNTQMNFSNGTSNDNKEIGVVTSGTFSPHLEKGIGMGFSKTELKEGHKIFVGDEKVKIEAEICRKPFIKNTSLKD